MSFDPNAIGNRIFTLRTNAKLSLAELQELGTAPCQTSGDFFAFRLIFGLIMWFFCTLDSNFQPRA